MTEKKFATPQQMARLVQMYASNELPFDATQEFIRTYSAKLKDLLERVWEIPASHAADAGKISPSLDPLFGPHCRMRYALEHRYPWETIRDFERASNRARSMRLIKVPKEMQWQHVSRCDAAMSALVGDGWRPALHGELMEFVDLVAVRGRQVWPEDVDLLALGSRVRNEDGLHMLSFSTRTRRFDECSIHSLLRNSFLILMVSELG